MKIPIISPEVEAMILADTKAGSLKELASREYLEVDYNRKEILFFERLFRSNRFSFGKFSTPKEILRMYAKAL